MRTVITAIIFLVLVFSLLGCEGKPVKCSGQSEIGSMILNKNWYINETMGKENLGAYFGLETTTIWHPNGFRQGSLCQSGTQMYFYPYENFEHQFDDEVFEVIHVEEKVLKISFRNDQIFTYYSK